MVWKKEYTLAAILVGIFTLMSILSPGNFLSSTNLLSMASQLPELGILSLGMMVVIISGGIDLSLVSISALSGIIAAFILREGTTLGMTDGGSTGLIVLAILGASAVALACGALNGFVVAKIGVFPILVTIGSQQLYFGVSNLLSKASSVSGFPSEYNHIATTTVLGIPLLLVTFIIVAVLTWILLSRTSWGRSVYMLGSNPLATRYSGINTVAVTFKVYVFSAMLALIAAILITSRYNAGKADMGSSYLLQTISVAVLGGTSIYGGTGSVLGVVLAAGILQVISSGCKMIGFSTYLIDIIMGAILIGTLLVITLTHFIGVKKKIKVTS
jgi:ribose/xylose/arabinose/galactoside ABC-type transport system permease subunit